MLKKIIERSNRPRKPVTRKALLVFLRWQFIFAGAAFVFSMLDLHDVLRLRAGGLVVLLFMSFGLMLAAYFDIVEGGLANNQKGTNAALEYPEAAAKPSVD